MGLSGAVPKFEWVEETCDTLPTAYEQIDMLMEILQERNLVAKHRPQQCPDRERDRPFVFEEINAIRLVFPKAALENLPGLNELAVWIAEPAENELSLGPYDWTGCFLYLTETWFDEKYNGSLVSGCSALQMIKNFIDGGVIYRLSSMGEEALGRGTFLHPVKKLIDCGAMSTGEVRKISSLYLKRYFTDEQCFSLSGVNYRTNDLLGYPLFIARELSR
ncbi:hypothetical protein HPC50_10830 [Corallococcus exiguus]|uniref:hypothetical protein n=1 Tax=Corallococcus TaxID=83461 RepID=UPI0011C4A918|nr:MULTISPECIES: hypothetical protein [Corallococcus]NPC47563.1 hypothetical protein [Corallococcus exiguus]